MSCNLENGISAREMDDPAANESISYEQKVRREYEIGFGNLKAMKNFPDNFDSMTIEERHDYLMKRMQEEMPRIFDTVPITLIELMPGMYMSGDCGRSPTERPDWLDIEKFRRGQKFAQDNMFGVFMAEVMSLFLLFSFEDGLKPLIFTYQSNTPYTSFKRYLSTVERVKNWYTSDPWTVGTPAYNDIQAVRKMHSAVRRRLLKISEEELKEACALPRMYCPSKDLITDDFRTNIPSPAVGQCPYSMVSKSIWPKGINQMDMACTQCGFIALTILYPKELGMHYATDEDLDDLCYLWRGIGYLLGIEDRYNFCRGTLKEVQQRARDFIEFWVKPNFREIAPEWEHMMRCVVMGLAYYGPGFSFEATLLYLAELLNCEMPRLYSSLTYRQWIKLIALRFILRYAFRVPGIMERVNERIHKSLAKAANYDYQKHEELKERSDISIPNVLINS